MNISITEYLFKVHKPSAMEGEARLRGLWRIIYSKTIISVYALPETGASHDTADPDRSQRI